jgi:hypothetical protein
MTHRGPRQHRMPAPRRPAAESGSPIAGHPLHDQEAQSRKRCGHADTTSPLGATHAPSLDTRFTTRKPNRVSDGDMPTPPRRSGLPTLRRRTLTTGILPFARCTPATLRHPGSACRRARLPGIGSPSLAITTHLMPIQRRIPRLTQQAPSGSEGITGGSMMRPLARHLNAASVHDSSHASRRWTCAALLQADRP